MMGSWSSVCAEQQRRQQNAPKLIEFVTQRPNHMAPQNVGQTNRLGCRSNVVDKQRRYGGGDRAGSQSLMRSVPTVAPNVAVQPGTNVIKGYHIYGSDCGGNPRSGPMAPGLGYYPIRHQAALGYPGGFIPHHHPDSVPSNFYQYQQQAACSYTAAADAQLNHIHG